MEEHILHLPDTQHSPWKLQNGTETTTHRCRSRLGTPIDSPPSAHAYLHSWKTLKMKGTPHWEERLAAVLQVCRLRSTNTFTKMVPAIRMCAWMAADAWEGRRYHAYFGVDKNLHPTDETEQDRYGLQLQLGLH